MEGMPVFYEYDMEGIKAQKKDLIKEGVLCGCLHDKTTAAIMDETPKGSTRAVDAAHPPVAEFGNIIIKTGGYSLPEMIEDIEQGIYARGLAGATTMGTKSMITSESGFLIENGELADPLDQVSLTIDSTTELQQIDAIGNDFSPASLRSYSGAYYALVGTGSPHIRFKALEVK
jgi:TldD protein